MLTKNVIQIKFLFQTNARVSHSLVSFNFENPQVYKRIKTENDLHTKTCQYLTPVGLFVYRVDKQFIL